MTEKKYVRGARHHNSARALMSMACEDSVIDAIAVAYLPSLDRLSFACFDAIGTAITSCWNTDVRFGHVTRGRLLHGTQSYGVAYASEAPYHRSALLADHSPSP